MHLFNQIEKRKILNFSKIEILKKLEDKKSQIPTFVKGTYRSKIIKPCNKLYVLPRIFNKHRLSIVIAVHSQTVTRVIEVDIDFLELHELGVRDIRIDAVERVALHLVDHQQAAFFVPEDVRDVHLQISEDFADLALEAELGHDVGDLF